MGRWREKTLRTPRLKSKAHCHLGTRKTIPWTLNAPPKRPPWGSLKFRQGTCHRCFPWDPRRKHPSIIRPIKKSSSSWVKNSSVEWTWASEHKFNFHGDMEAAVLQASNLSKLNMLIGVTINPLFLLFGVGTQILWVGHVPFEHWGLQLVVEEWVASK